MLKVKQKERKQIIDLQTDLEVINPIESKKILGGEWYDGRWTGVTSDGNGGMIMTFHNGGSGGSWGDGAGTFGGTFDPFDTQYSDEGEDRNDSGGGGSDGADNSYGELLENPTMQEITWLINNVDYQQLNLMIDNKNFALEKAAPIPGAFNGLGDAFRHALWSAADAADIGLQKATEFHTLHETANPVNDGSNQMDLFNNNWGFNWFSQNGDPVSNMTQFINDFNNAVANGQIQTKP